MSRTFPRLTRAAQLFSALSRAISSLPSWSTALVLLLVLHGCVISESRSCARCHRDCGWGRQECHDACDESEACGGPTDAEVCS